GVGIDEADRDRVHAFLAERRQRLQHVGLVERVVYDAVCADALGDRQPKPARHEWPRGGWKEVVGIGAVAPSDLERIAEAARGEQADDGAPALENRVEADRRSVQEQS